MIGSQQAVLRMVTPDALKLHVIPADALAEKTEPHQKTDRWYVIGKNHSHDTVKMQFIEDDIQHLFHCLSGITQML